MSQTVKVLGTNAKAELPAEIFDAATNVPLIHQVVVAQLAAAPTFDFFALYGVAAVYYWVVCMILSFFQGRLETRLGRYVLR